MMGDITWGGDSVWAMQYGVVGSGSAASGTGTLDVTGPVRSASASSFNISTPLLGSGVLIVTADVDVYDPATGGYHTESAPASTAKRLSAPTPTRVC